MLKALPQIDGQFSFLPKADSFADLLFGTNSLSLLWQIYMCLILYLNPDLLGCDYAFHIRTLPTMGRAFCVFIPTFKPCLFF